MDSTKMEEGQIEQLRKADIEHYIHPNTRLQTHAATGPVIWVRGDGCRLQASNGRWYIDGMASLWNVNVGHGRKDLRDAAYQQMSELEYTSSFAGFSTRPSIELAEKLSAITPGRLSAVMFGSGGSESNDTAFKMARYYWKCVGKPDKTVIISRYRAFHGVTVGATSATGMPVYWDMFSPMAPDFTHIDPPYGYRTPPGAPAMTGDALEAKILEVGAENVAAFVAEPVQGAGGVLVPPDGYWQNVRRICDKHNVLLIADEIICGFGRTGRWFGVNNWDIAPDVMVMAKGITSGYLPLGATIVTDEIYRGLQSRPEDPPFMHGYTYAGHATVCAVANANIAIIEREGLVERARTVGEYAQRKLKTLESLPNVGEVRGIGLMAGVELVRDKVTKESFPGNWRVGARVAGAAMERGLISRGLFGDTMAFSPPLIITEQEIDQSVEALGGAIEAVMRELASEPARA